MRIRALSSRQTPMKRSPQLTIPLTGSVDQPGNGDDPGSQGVITLTQPSPTAQVAANPEEGSEAISDPSPLLPSATATETQFPTRTRQAAIGDPTKGSLQLLGGELNNETSDGERAQGHFKLIYLTPIFILVGLFLVFSVGGRVWGRLWHSREREIKRRSRHARRMAKEQREEELARIQQAWGYVPPGSAPSGTNENEKFLDEEEDDLESDDERFTGPLQNIGSKIMGARGKAAPPTTRSRRGKYESKVHSNSWWAVHVRRALLGDPREQELVKYTQPVKPPLRHTNSRERLRQLRKEGGEDMEAGQGLLTEVGYDFQGARSQKTTLRATLRGTWNRIKKHIPQWNVGWGYTGKTPGIDQRRALMSQASDDQTFLGQPNPISSSGLLMPPLLGDDGKPYLPGEGPKYDSARRPFQRRSSSPTRTQLRNSYLGISAPENTQKSKSSLTSVLDIFGSVAGAFRAVSGRGRGGFQDSEGRGRHQRVLDVEEAEGLESPIHTHADGSTCSLDAPHHLPRSSTTITLSEASNVVMSSVRVESVPQPPRIAEVGPASPTKALSRSGTTARLRTGTSYSSETPNHRAADYKYSNEQETPTKWRPANISSTARASVNGPRSLVSPPTSPTKLVRADSTRSNSLARSAAEGDVFGSTPMRQARSEGVFTVVEEEATTAVPSRNAVNPLPSLSPQSFRQPQSATTRRKPRTPSRNHRPVVYAGSSSEDDFEDGEPSWRFRASHSPRTPSHGADAAGLRNPPNTRETPGMPQAPPSTMADLLSFEADPPPKPGKLLEAGMSNSPNMAVRRARMLALPAESAEVSSAEDGFISSEEESVKARNQRKKMASSSEGENYSSDEQVFNFSSGASSSGASTAPTTEDEEGTVIEFVNDDDARGGGRRSRAKAGGALGKDFSDGESDSNWEGHSALATPHQNSCEFVAAIAEIECRNLDEIVGTICNKPSTIEACITSSKKVTGSKMLPTIPLTDKGDGSAGGLESMPRKMKSTSTLAPTELSADGSTAKTEWSWTASTRTNYSHASSWAEGAEAENVVADGPATPLARKKTWKQKEGKWFRVQGTGDWEEGEGDEDQGDEGDAKTPTTRPLKDFVSPSVGHSLPHFGGRASLRGRENRGLSRAASPPPLPCPPLSPSSSKVGSGGSRNNNNVSLPSSLIPASPKNNLNKASSSNSPSLMTCCLTPPAKIATQDLFFSSPSLNSSHPAGGRRSKMVGAAPSSPGKATELRHEKSSTGKWIKTQAEAKLREDLQVEELKSKPFPETTATGIASSPSSPRRRDAILQRPPRKYQKSTKPHQSNQEGGLLRSTTISAKMESQLAFTSTGAEISRYGSTSSNGSSQAGGGGFTTKSDVGVDYNFTGGRQDTLLGRVERTGATAAEAEAGDLESKPSWSSTNEVSAKPRRKNPIVTPLEKERQRLQALERVKSIVNKGYASSSSSSSTKTEEPKSGFDLSRSVSMRSIEKRVVRAARDSNVGIKASKSEALIGG